MKQADKDAAMQRFISGEINLLVATTVIEVGVDVKDASVIIIEQAERFGLSQLHQLRGRVGRGNIQSYCILLYQRPLSKLAAARLKIIRETEDGFIIAENDLKLRGEGEVLGVKQSGAVNFKIANLELHGALFEQAAHDAKNIMNQDPGLTSPRGVQLRFLLELQGYTEQLANLPS
jgi:ATP-dependent DNA helicase RecG